MVTFLEVSIFRKITLNFIAIPAAIGIGADILWL